jgi:hypothetical protein
VIGYRPIATNYLHLDINRSSHGNQFTCTLDSSPGNDLGSPAVGYAEQIAKRLRAAE